jgi:hypothetical protein
MVSQRLVKVNFKLDPQDWHGSGGETLWASVASPESKDRTLRLENSPFHARGVSYRDIVKAMPTENPLVHEFEEVIARGGHSTYMILAREGEGVESPAFLALWTLLKERGCSYESSHMEYSNGRRLLLSVDVPPNADLFDIYKILERGEATGVWTFQEGYAHLPRRGS